MFSRSEKVDENKKELAQTSNKKCRKMETGPDYIIGKAEYFVCGVFWPIIILVCQSLSLLQFHLRKD